MKVITKPTIDKTSIAIVVEAIRKNAAPLSKQIGKLEIKTQDEFDLAAGKLKQLKVMAAIAKEKQSEITNPIKQSLGLISQLFKPFFNEVEELDAAVKLRMSVFLESKKEAGKKLEQRFKDGNLKLETFVSKANELNTNTSVAQLRNTKKLVISNKKLIPAKFLEPNESLIKKELLAGKPVPGCKLVDDITIAI